jgi:glutathione S-transferase
MTITITAFDESSPDSGQGLARDMRVRWALEEVDQPYEVRLAPWGTFREPVHLARNPFGQIPTYEEVDLTLFESGAIVLHIAEAFRVCCRRMRMRGRVRSCGCLQHSRR